MAEETDVAALFERLKEEIRAAGPRGDGVTPAQVRLSVRDQAERLWAVSAERPLVGKAGPVKLVLRRLMRWYVEPAFADQRTLGRDRPEALGLVAHREPYLGGRDAVAAGPGGANLLLQPRKQGGHVHLVSHGRSLGGARYGTVRGL